MDLANRQRDAIPTNDLQLTSHTRPDDQLPLGFVEQGRDAVSVLAPCCLCSKIRKAHGSYGELSRLHYGETQSPTGYGLR
jgi:hypothetical protein